MKENTNEMNVLGIDIGSKSFAFAFIKDGEYVKSWVSDFLGNENVYALAHDALLEALRIWEMENLIDKNSDFIAFENIPMRFGWARILIELVGHIKTVCGQRDLGFMEISPTTIKKCILAYGKSPKDQKEKKALMVNKINEMFGLSLTDHNESDACGIAFTAWLLENEE